MSLRRRAEVRPDKDRTVARDRLSRIATAEVMNWADQVGTGIAKALDDFRRTGDRDALLEAQHGASALAGALDTLLERAKA